MAERPIIFSAPMVRAILEGRKTQTRRVLKPQPDTAKISPPFHPEPRGGRYWVFMARDDFPGYSFATADFRTPYAIGDLLWVREAWAPISTIPPSAIYRADGAKQPGACCGCAWKSPIHMPREFSRITLRVTDVRVQRLQDISEEDAKAEGVEFSAPTPEDEEWNQSWCEEHGYPIEPLQGVWLAPGTRQGYGPRRNDPQWGPTPEFAFRLSWDSLNAKRGYPWETNPWVAAISFERATQGGENG